MKKLLAILVLLLASLSLPAHAGVGTYGVEIYQHAIASVEGEWGVVSVEGYYRDYVVDSSQGNYPPMLCVDIYFSATETEDYGCNYEAADYMVFQPSKGVVYFSGPVTTFAGNTYQIDVVLTKTDQAPRVSYFPFAGYNTTIAWLKVSTLNQATAAGTVSLDDEVIANFPSQDYNYAEIGWDVITGLYYRP